MWKISEGGMMRSDPSRKKIVKPTENQVILLNNYLETKFNISLNNIKHLIVIDNYTHNILSIQEKNGKVIEHILEENLPDELSFYRYKFIPINNIDNNEILLKISYGSSY